MSLQEAVVEVGEKARPAKDEGVDQAALDAAAAKGFGNALFEYDEDEISLVAEEFFPSDVSENLKENSHTVSKLRTNLWATRSASD